MQLSGLRAAIDRLDTDQNVFSASLGVLDENVEIAVVVEDAGVNQLEFQIALAAPPVLLDQSPVRKFALRILVKELHVGVGWRGVEIKIIFLDVFSVIPLIAREAKEP